MPVCMCPSCKQMISASLRCCIHCGEDLNRIESGRGRSLLFIAAIIGLPLLVSIIATLIERRHAEAPRQMWATAGPELHRGTVLLPVDEEHARQNNKVRYFLAVQPVTDR